MQKQYPLLIGMPILYRLIDIELLKNHNIEPIFTYHESMGTIGIGQSVYYKELSIDEISRIIESKRPDAIICFNDNFLIEAAQLRTKYGIPGLQDSEISKFKIKSEMYKTLNPYLAVPNTIFCYDNLKYENIVEHMGAGEYFIKPDNLAGAEGSCHIKNKNDYLRWKSSSLRNNTVYILQKYNSSSLVHCELIVQAGAIKYIQARRYSYPNHMFLKGKIIASFPIVDNAVRYKIEQYAIEVQQRLGYMNGVMHTEFFLEDNNNLIFLETNIRQAGGAINLLHRERAGVGFETVMVLVELGKDVSITLNEDNYNLSGYIPLQKGRVSQINVPKLKGRYEFDFRVKIGACCESPKSASNVAASFVGGSSIYNDLINDFFCLENSSIIQYS